MTPFKAKLRAGEQTWLINPDHPSAGLVEVVARLGFDAVMIDCEQGSPGFEDIEHLTRAARLHGAASLVRIPSPEPWTIERYVMRGVDGIVVPRLDTAAQAERAIADIRYAAGGRFEDVSVVMQIESVSAVAELDRFLELQAVDGFFLGAVDLSKSMGHGGDYSVPDVRQQCVEVIRRVRAAGRAAACLVREDDLPFWVSQGATVLYAHVDAMLRTGAEHWKRLAEPAPERPMPKA